MPLPESSMERYGSTTPTLKNIDLATGSTTILAPNASSYLNHSEIRKLFGLAAIKAMRWCRSLLLENGKVKVKLAVGKGKVDYDKREDIRKRDSDRELRRVMMQHVKAKPPENKKASEWGAFCMMKMKWSESDFRQTSSTGAWEPW